MLLGKDRDSLQIKEALWQFYQRIMTHQHKVVLTIVIEIVRSCEAITLIDPLKEGNRTAVLKRWLQLWDYGFVFLVIVAISINKKPSLIEVYPFLKWRDFLETDTLRLRYGRVDCLCLYIILACLFCWSIEIVFILIALLGHFEMSQSNVVIKGCYYLLSTIGCWIVNDMRFNGEKLSFQERRPATIVCNDEEAIRGHLWNLHEFFLSCLQAHGDVVLLQFFLQMHDVACLEVGRYYVCWVCGRDKLLFLNAVRGFSSSLLVCTLSEWLKLLSFH